MKISRHSIPAASPGHSHSGIIPAKAGMQGSLGRAIFSWRLDPRARADDGRADRGVGLRQGCPLGFAHKQAACCTWRSQGHGASFGIGLCHTPANNPVSAVILPFAANEMTFPVSRFCVERLAVSGSRFAGCIVAGGVLAS